MHQKKGRMITTSVVALVRHLPCVCIKTHSTKDKTESPRSWQLSYPSLLGPDALRLRLTTSLPFSGITPFMISCNVREAVSSETQLKSSSIRSAKSEDSASRITSEEEVIDMRKKRKRYSPSF